MDIELNTGLMTLALTLLVEVLAAGIFIGVVKTTLANVVKDVKGAIEELREHERGDVARTHGCPFIQLTHRQES